MAVPKDIYKAIRHCPTVKKMWETLTVMFEGCETSLESTRTTLTRRYERFFALKNESLTGTHTRFNALVNDLISIDINKEASVLKSKFLDSLPPKWNHYVASVKLSPVYKELDLPGLYGLLHNHERTEAEKLIAMGEAIGSSTSALVASQAEYSNFYSNDPISSQPVCNTVETEKEGSETDYYSSDETESLANEVAMLAERLKRRSFSKFKGKAKGTSGNKSRKPLDMSKVTCYKCGKTGHMANDCRSKANPQAESSKPQNNEKDDKYSKLRLKYKKLKAQVAKLSEKSLVAKDWAESATSSEDETYEDAKCFMAKEAKEKFLDNMAKIREQNSQSAQGASTSNEVSLFFSLTDEEKLAKLNRLGDEVLIQKHFKKQGQAEMTCLRNEICKQGTTIEKLQTELKSLKQVNIALLQEAKESEEKFLKLKKITESWCVSAKRTAKCVNDQIPQQVQAVFEGDYDKAIAISEVCAMEPCYQPIPPPIIKNKGKKKAVDTHGLGFDSEESRTKSEGEVSLNASKLTTPSKSVFIPAKTKKNSSNNDKSKSESKSQQTKAKVIQSKVNANKSEAKPTIMDSDSLISKLIESRLSEISKEVSFLSNLSSIDQKKLQAESKKAGISKGIMKQKETNVVNKRKSGKGYLKQQWISRSNDKSSSCSQAESDSVSSCEPILGWVPKKN